MLLKTAQNNVYVLCGVYLYNDLGPCESERESERERERERETPVYLYVYIYIYVHISVYIRICIYTPHSKWGLWKGHMGT